MHLSIFERQLAEPATTQANEEGDLRRVDELSKAVLLYPRRAQSCEAVLVDRHLP